MSEDLQTAMDHTDGNNKDFDTQATVVELDNGSTSDAPPPTNSSSEDLVHSKHGLTSRQGRRSVSYHEEDLEAAHPPMHVSVDTKYEIGPGHGLDSPRGNNVRPWSSGWPGPAYGNRTTIEAENKMPEER